MARRRWLVLVTGDFPEPAAREPLARTLQGVAGLADAVVLRWTGASARQRLDVAAFLRQRAPDVPLLLRDRFDIARAAGLAGVQLPEDGLPAHEVRGRWPDALIGVSRHDVPGLTGRSDGADYALFSPVFPTSSKPGAAGCGLAGLRRAAEAAPVPLLALGGIDADNAAAVIRAGAWGVAVRSAVFGSGDPVAATRRLRERIDAA